MTSSSFVGLDFPTVPNLKECLSIATDNGFSFIRGPIVNNRNVRDVYTKASQDKIIPLTRSDLILNSQDWSGMMVGRISDWIDCDVEDDALRIRSTRALEQELCFSFHLGLFATTVTLHGLNHVNLARIIHGRITKTQIGYKVWAHVPLMSKGSMAAVHRRDKHCESSEESTWHWWTKFHSICGDDKNIAVLLEITADLPSGLELDRWLGEPIKAILISTSTFLTNKKGFPVLSQMHQIFLRKVSKITNNIILTGSNKHASLTHYVKYINRMYEMSVTNSSPYSRGYEDHLQVPLQPLMDNLESTVYETFEKDPVKYSEYQKAIYMALVDRTESMEVKKQVITVVGAGRGPLINACLHAAEQANVNVKIYAVEKNPNAIVTLYHLKEEVWKDKVGLFHCDMRNWKAPEKCDILVSELLGSFGDNELSPECLDGAQQFLKDDGISIPCRYTSYIKPIQSKKLFVEAHAGTSPNKVSYYPYEVPYVVHQINIYPIAKLLPVFTFYHPNRDPKNTNDRYAVLEFKAEQDTVMHGFAGYFDTVLYKEVMLSIVPENISKGMFSWFPMYFPIKEPIRIKAGDNIVVHIWRLSDAKQVWYEWCVSEPSQSPIHNTCGRSFSIGLL